MLTTEIRTRFINAIKEGTAELNKMQNGTYQIQEVLDEFNRVLNLVIVVKNGYLYAGNTALFGFEPRNKSFPIRTTLNSSVIYIEDQEALINWLCESLKTPSIVKLIREQQNAK